MKLTRSFYSKAAAAALSLAALGSAGVAQARGDVYWSVGVHAAPGISVGVGNTYQAYPSYPSYSYPVYSEPVYVAPPVVYYPSNYYVRPAPVYYSQGYYSGPTFYRVHGHRKHHRHYHAYRY